MIKQTNADWKSCSGSLPPDGEPVMTKIDDADGCRNEQVLTRQGSVWIVPDGSMYVYYRPTHWKSIPPEGEGL